MSREKTLIVEAILEKYLVSGDQLAAEAEAIPISSLHAAAVELSRLLGPAVDLEKAAENARIADGMRNVWSHQGND